jgi:hypothetical protein
MWPSLPLERELGRGPVSKPDGTDALRVDSYYLLFATLDERFDEELLWKRLKELHAWAGIVRSSLAANQKDDILLILVGPLGSLGGPKWRAFAATVERDDRICRKIIWLPSDASSLPADAREFLRRTFLAQPWELALGANAQELDAGRRFQLAVEQQASVEPDDARLAASWWSLLVATADEEGDPVAPGPSLVKRMIAALDGDDK